MLACGVPEETIKSICLNPHYGIAKKCLGQGEKWLDGEIARIKEKAAEMRVKVDNVDDVPALQALLETHFLLQVGATCASATTSWRS